MTNFLKMDLRIIFIIGFLFCTSITKSQTNYKDLKGYWITNNSESSYYRNDTIRFLNTSERFFCDNIVWIIDKPSGFKLTKCDCCNEPPRITAQSRQQSLKLKNGILCYFIGKDLSERFRVIDLSYVNYQSPNGFLKLRQLTLLRIK